MDAMKLTEALSGLDDDLLHEADTAAGNPMITPLYRNIRTLVAAACLILLFGSSFAFRGAALKTNALTSFNNDFRNYAMNELNIELEIKGILNNVLEVSDGTISVINKDGSIIEHETPYKFNGKTQIMWNITPDTNEPYSLTVMGGLIRKTIVLQYDTSTEQWTITQ